MTIIADRFTHLTMELTTEHEMEKREAMMMSDGVTKAAASVRRMLGPNLPKSVYAMSLAYELVRAGFSVEQDKPLTYVQDNAGMDCGCRVDLLVNNVVLVELRAAGELVPADMMQMRTYLALTGLKIGLLVDFGVDAVQRDMVHVVDLFGASA